MRGRGTPSDVVWTTCAHPMVVSARDPAGWFPRFRGRYFDVDSWDGTDLFMERPDERGRITLHRYVASRVARALRRENIRQLEIRALADIELHAEGVRIGTPDQMPADYEGRAAEAYARQGVPRPPRSDE